MQKLELDDNHGIVLLRGKSRDGHSIYAYVKVDKSDIDEIERAYHAGKEIDYSTYKGILKHDWGDEPTDNVKLYMERTYGFKHHD